jgi:hypothetical protein
MEHSLTKDISILLVEVNTQEEFTSSSLNFEGWDDYVSLTCCQLSSARVFFLQLNWGQEFQLIFVEGFKIRLFS